MNDLKKIIENKVRRHINERLERISRWEAKEIAMANGIDFDTDFHALSHDHMSLLVTLAKRSGYRKPVSASGSTARYFYYNLQRIK